MERYREGYATVEAALVISFILFLMAAFILMMFYLHDRAVLCVTALRDADRIMKMTEEPVSEQGRLEMKRLKEQSFLRTGDYRASVNTESREARFREEAGERLYLTEVTFAEIELSDRSVILRYTGRFRVPLGGVAEKLFEGILAISGEVKLEKGMAPEEIVRLAGSIRRE